MQSASVGTKDISPNREIYAGVLYFKNRNPHDSDEEIANSVCRYVGMKRVKGNEIW